MLDDRAEPTERERDSETKSGSQRESEREASRVSVSLRFARIAP